jgi:hypothetical protein
MGSPLIGSFQTRVNLYNPLGVAGDFASANPRASALTTDGGALIAGPNGVTIGKFAWIEADGRTVTNQGQYPALPDGFVHRDQQGLLTQYLQAAGTLIPPGFPVTLMVQGEFLAYNAGPSTISRRSSIYASYLDGSVTTAAGTGGSVTATLGSTNTASLGATFTGAASTASTSLVVTAVTGLISIGDTVGGSGITDSPTIIAQTAGTTGGAGTYTLSKAETCTGGTVTCFGSTVKVTAVSTYISIGDTISKTNYPSSATIVAQVSGTTGSTGVYTISAPGTQYVASATAVLTYGYTVSVTAVGSGSFSPGQPVVDATNATYVVANTVIESQVSGTPGQTGIYTLSLPAISYSAGDNLTTTAGIQLTNWTAIPPQSNTAVAVGDLVQISTWGA